MTEEEDFMERHGDDIAEAIKPTPFRHYPHCRVGHRWWSLSGKWPFIRTGLHGGICICEINRILDKRPIDGVPDDLEEVEIRIGHRVWHFVRKKRI